jgi:hypothetical protein
MCLRDTVIHMALRSTTKRMSEWVNDRNKDQWP